MGVLMIILSLAAAGVVADTSPRTTCSRRPTMSIALFGSNITVSGVAVVIVPFAWARSQQRSS